MGNAIAAASRDARQQILEMVAKAWSENPEDLDIIDGKVISYKSEESISFKNIVIYGINLPNDQGWTGGPVLGRGNFMPTYITGLDPETGQGPLPQANAPTPAVGAGGRIYLAGPTGLSGRAKEVHLRPLACQPKLRA